MLAEYNDRFVKAVKVETRLMGYGDFVVGQKGNIFSSLVIGHQTQHLLTGRMVETSCFLYKRFSRLPISLTE